MNNASQQSILFSGTSNRQLTQEIADILGWQLGDLKIGQFPDGETFLKVNEHVREKKVFIVQSVVHKPNEYLMELLLAVDALKRCAAGEIIAVLPYFGYCRQDRREEPHVPISARLVANMLERAGVTQILAMDLHTKQLQGFFDVPVDELHACRKLFEAVDASTKNDLVVVAPDVGGSKMARDYASHLGCNIVITEKQRDLQGNVTNVTLIGSVTGKIVLLADDMCATGGTLASAAKACHEKGARKIFAVATHGLFVKDAVKNIEQSPIEAVIVSNTVPLTEEARNCPKVRPVSVASLFASAIHRISAAESLSSLTQ